MHVVKNLAPSYYYHYKAQRGNKHGKIYRFIHFNNNNCWNPDVGGDDVTDAQWPYIPAVTYPSNTDDALMIIVDKSASSKFTAYEISHGTNTTYLEGGCAPCTTFNIWNLGFRGVVTERSGDIYWPWAGTHGAGTSLIAGLIRPKELEDSLAAPLSPDDPNYNPDVPLGDGYIHHVLKFCFNFNRCGPPLYPPAYRNDGAINGVIPDTYACDDHRPPVEGMLFQLMDPNNKEALVTNRFARVIVRTLKKYGMVLVDNGSNNESMTIYLQNMYTLGGQTNEAWWKAKFGDDFLTSLEAAHITAADFRVVDTQTMHGAHLLGDHCECCSQGDHCHPLY